MKNESDSGFDGPVSKRQKTEDFDPHKTQPSPVLHVRGLGDAAIEADLVEAVQHFGSVKDIIMIPHKKQALIEFDDISSAKNCVEYVQNSMIYVAGQPAYFNFSTSLKIQRPGDLNDSRPSNHVLLFSILNPHYPINTEHFDPHKTQPSPVLHVRGLGDAAIEADLVETVQHFGSVKDIIMILFKKQALIEFDDISSAKNCVEYVQNSMIYVAGQPAYLNFSTSLKIQCPGDLNDSRPSNHVLLFSILNPHYSINTDVMHTICSPYGTVLRIVIFKKNGVQAMVEFDGVESTKRAKQSLNGADVYSGCCTLKIEFTKDRFDDPHRPKPSRVIHVRGLSDSAIESDLVEALRHFGAVTDVIMMPRRKQALVQFETG